VPSFRPALEMEIETWKDYRRALPPEEKKIFDKMLDYSRIHADAGSMAARPILSEFLFFSIMLEQEKRIEDLEERISELEKKNNG